jgi:hypothetical protein
VSEGFNDLDDVGQVVDVVSHVGRKLVVDALFPLVPAETADVKLHHLLPQPPPNTLPLTL